MPYSTGYTYKTGASRPVDLLPWMTAPTPGNIVANACYLVMYLKLRSYLTKYLIDFVEIKTIVNLSLHKIWIFIYVLKSYG